LAVGLETTFLPRTLTYFSFGQTGSRAHLWLASASASKRTLTRVKIGCRQAPNWLRPKEPVWPESWATARGRTSLRRIRRWRSSHNQGAPGSETSIKAGAAGTSAGF